MTNHGDIECGLDYERAAELEEERAKTMGKKLKAKKLDITPEPPELGETVRDSVTGFKGVVTAITSWLNGCIRCVVQPPVDKDGKVPAAESFDYEQLETVEPAPET